jgi:hypothetical protein
LVACFRQRERSRRLNDMSRLDRTWSDPKHIHLW